MIGAKIPELRVQPQIWLVRRSRARQPGKERFNNHLFCKSSRALFARGSTTRLKKKATTVDCKLSNQMETVVEKREVSLLRSPSAASTVHTRIYYPLLSPNPRAMSCFPLETKTSTWRTYISLTASVRANRARSSSEYNARHPAGAAAPAPAPAATLVKVFTSTRLYLSLHYIGLRGGMGRERSDDERGRKDKSGLRRR